MSGALTVAVLARPACAAEPPSLRKALFGRFASDGGTPTVARYEIEPGRNFTFDRADRGEALLKFDNEQEIWVLKPTVGPHGDIIYKNDMDQSVVRLTRMGGLTVFTAGRPAGAAAAFVGQCAPPKAPNLIGPDALSDIEILSSARASHAAQRLIEFDAPEVTPLSEHVYAEAFAIAAEAFVRLSRRGGLVQKYGSRLSVVRFVSGHEPSAVLVGTAVQITIAPQLGEAGRPSSERVAAVIASH